MCENRILLNKAISVQALNAGLFISSGQDAIHPERIIDSYELIFVRRGVLGLKEENRSYEVHRGETLILFPGRLHAGSLPYPPDLQFYWVHFYLGDMPEEQDSNSLSVLQYAAIKRPNRMVSLFRAFLDDQESYPRPEIALNAYIILMLSEVAWDNSVAGTAVSDGDTRLASLVTTTIRSKLDQITTASDVAGITGYNPDYLGRIYHRVYGQTITDAIHMQRLKRAKALLVETNLSMEQITRRCGYSDLVYFRRVFKKLEDMTPLAYRRLYTKIHINT